MARKTKKTKSKRKKLLKDYHEEHKVLLFMGGVVFGIGICSLAYQAWFAALAMLSVLVVLWMIEKREN